VCFNDAGWAQFTSHGSDSTGNCCHIADRSNVGAVCTSASTCASSTHAAAVTAIGIPAIALEAAMEKARAKAVRFYADDPSMPEPI
jgi:hypothetical protein